MSHANGNARLENNKILLWRNFTMSALFLLYVEFSSRVDRNYVDASENKNFQFSIHVTINHPSITVTWYVSRAIFCLFWKKGSSSRKQPTNQLQRQSVFGELLSIFKRPICCCLSISPYCPLSLNQKTLYHNFLFLFHSQIAIKNKNTCVKLKDTQNSHLDWWSARTKLWRCFESKHSRDIDVAQSIFTIFSSNLWNFLCR